MKTRWSKVYQSSDEEFSQLVKNSKSICDVAKKIGLSVNGGNSYRLIRQRIEELKLDISHFNIGTQAATLASTKYTLEDIMVENSTYTNFSRFKERLIKANIIPYVCAQCGCKPEWQGKPLVLQLDHINGIHTDNRKENLRFLCPNCHSQTKTFCRK